MNLNYDPSPAALQALLSTADGNLPAHTIALDYDGEVIVDPELQYPHVDLRRYQYHTRIWNAGIRSAQKIQHLHTTMMQVLDQSIQTLGSSDLHIAA